MFNYCYYGLINEVQPPLVLVGVSAHGFAGTATVSIVNPGVTTNPSGVQANGTSGSLLLSISPFPSGVVGTTSVGTAFGNLPANVSGVQANGALGIILRDFSAHSNVVAGTTNNVVQILNFGVQSNGVGASFKTLSGIQSNTSAGIFFEAIQFSPLGAHITTSVGNAFAQATGKGIGASSIGTAGFISNQSIILPAGLVAWWNFTNLGKDAVDGFGGTLTGTTLTSDLYGRPARSFNGTSDVIIGTTSPIG